jgi:hypothetical protein
MEGTAVRLGLRGLIMVIPDTRMVNHTARTLSILDKLVTKKTPRRARTEGLRRHACQSKG